MRNECWEYETRSLVIRYFSVLSFSFSSHLILFRGYFYHAFIEHDIQVRTDLDDKLANNRLDNENFDSQS